MKEKAYCLNTPEAVLFHNEDAKLYNLVISLSYKLYGCDRYPIEEEEYIKKY